MSVADLTPEGYRNTVKMLREVDEALMQAHQRIEELEQERDDWKHRGERGEVSGWKGRAESAEAALQELVEVVRAAMRDENGELQVFGSVRERLAAALRAAADRAEGRTDA